MLTTMSKGEKKGVGKRMKVKSMEQRLVFYLQYNLGRDNAEILVHGPWSA